MSVKPLMPEPLEWAWQAMPVLSNMAAEMAAQQSFAGVKVAACLHLTAEAGCLAASLAAAGARVAVCSASPSSAKPEVLTALRELGLEVFAQPDEDERDAYHNLTQAADFEPDFCLDTGARLITAAHAAKKMPQGGIEETSEGAARLREMAARDELGFPVLAARESETARFFDSRYGTGQAVVDAFMRATNRLLAGTNFVVVGYGWRGKGVARAVGGLGARVIVCEVDPTRALRAVMDGYEVVPLAEAVVKADVICTVAGKPKALTREHFELMRDGCVITCAGHGHAEVDVAALREMVEVTRVKRPHVDELTLKDGRCLELVAKGLPMQMVAAEGHPAEALDLHFANLVLCLAYFQEHATDLSHRVYPVPAERDRELASLKLKSLGVRIDGQNGLPRA